MIGGEHVKYNMCVLGWVRIGKLFHFSGRFFVIYVGDVAGAENDSPKKNRSNQTKRRNLAAVTARRTQDTHLQAEYLTWEAHGKQKKNKME